MMMMQNMMHPPVRDHQHDSRTSLYVGNLTWWTTDEDVVQSIQAIGVNDVTEVKFFENRGNGQSKGFCVVSFSSETSLPVVMEHLPKLEINGQVPLVTPCTMQNLNLFESNIRDSIGGGVGASQNPPRPPPSLGGGLRSDSMVGGGGRPHQPIGMIRPHQQQQPVGMIRPHQQHPSPIGACLLPPHHNNNQQQVGMIRPHQQPQQQIGMIRPHQQQPIQQQQQIGMIRPSNGTPPIMNDYEEIMAKNRSVSSLAISHALQDAASGEFQKAIDTLATAITLIKQSRVSGDERCKMLITSLQDTLNGIEARCYGRDDVTTTRDVSLRRSRSRDRERERERDRDRDRERDREKGGDSDHHGRSRDQDRGERDHRDHRDRRDRDRDHERDRDRIDRDKERDRTRSGRSDRDRERDRERGDRGGDREKERSRDRDRERERDRDHDRDRSHRDRSDRDREHRATSGSRRLESSSSSSSRRRQA